MDLETFQLETNTANDEFTLKVAQEELRETPANIQYGLKTLRKLLDEIDQENPQATRFPKHNELWLLNFLRICKFYPESAKDRVSTLKKTACLKFKWIFHHFSIDPPIL